MAELEESSLMKQFISYKGVFDAAKMQEFSRTVGLHGCGQSYQVVAVIGPQSIGKSTLLNCLFGTNFRMMKANKIGQTTQGLWIAKAEGREPLTIVVDLEGTDSRERGEDGTAFEKQSSLFALAVADVVLINIHHKDIGRENASGRPLFRSVFQAMVRLAGNDPIPTNKTLIYVIRDQAKDSSFEDLEHNLRESIQRIWDSIIKPEAYKDTPLAKIFNVKVAALPNYEEREEEFKEQVAQLGQRYFPPGGGAAAGDRKRLPYSEFYSSADEIWKRIRADRDLDLPAYWIMVATKRCEDIAKEKLRDFKIDKDWVNLEKVANANAGEVPRLGESARTILNRYILRYNEESQYFDEQVRDAKRKVLESKGYQAIYPTYKNMLRQLHPISLRRFEKDLKELLGKDRNTQQEHLDRRDGFAAAVSECTRSCIQEFDRQCSGAAIEQAKWDASEAREKLHRDIEAHASRVRNEKLQDILLDAQNRLPKPFGEVVKSRFEDGRQDPWPLIRRLLDKECAASGPIFSSLFAAFELDPPTAQKMADHMKKYARIVVVNVATERADTALSHMNNRFDEVNPEAENDLKNEALDECVKLLSTMAVIRLDERSDNVQYVLHYVLRNGISVAGNLASTTWDNVPPQNTLISPIKCRTLWEEFLTICEMKIHDAETLRQTHVQEGVWKIPSAWVLVPLTLAAAAVVGLLYPEISLAVASLPLMWLVKKAVSLLFSNGLGLYKEARDFSVNPNQKSRVTPIVIKIAELLSVVLGEFLRHQPMAA